MHSKGKEVAPGAVAQKFVTSLHAVRDNMMPRDFTKLVLPCRGAAEIQWSWRALRLRSHWKPPREHHLPAHSSSMPCMMAGSIFYCAALTEAITSMMQRSTAGPP